MVSKKLNFKLKDPKFNPEIKERQLIGIAIQTWHDYVWSSCGYLMLSNDQIGLEKLKKTLHQDHFFHLDTDMRVEDFTEDVISDEGRKLGTIGKKKIYVEDSYWAQKIKLVYINSIEYFIPKTVIQNENNLLHVEIEPINFYHDGLIDKLIFTGEKINQYRNLINQNLGKEFKMPMPIFYEPPSINTNEWIEKRHQIELVEEPPIDRPEKTVLEIKNDLEKYYRENSIKMINMELSEENEEVMNIIFNNGKKKSSNGFPNRRDKQKLEQVKIYLKSNNKESLTYSDLILVSDDNNSHNPNSGVTITLLIIVLLLAVGFLLFSLKKNRNKEVKI